MRERADELLEFVQLTEKAKAKVEDLSGGMKRRLTIARVADQPARPAAARRADHRPRPAGPARAVGPAVPAQAAGRDAGDHHALHGRGRAAVRPARGHGQGPDRRRGLAARADPRSTPPARSPSCGSACGEPRGARPRRSPTSASGSRCCPTGCCSTPTTARTSLAQVHERGLRPGRDAGPPLHPRGRLPPAHRPDAGGLMADQLDRRVEPATTAGCRLAGIGRQYDYWATVYRRTWKGSVITSFVVAAALRAGDGRAARRLRRGRPRASSRARRPTSPSSCPAWSPRRRCRPRSARRPTR